MDLTRTELSRQDLVDNAIHRMLCKISERELPWDQHLIAKVREAAYEVVVVDLTIMNEYQFYPWVKED